MQKFIVKIDLSIFFEDERKLVLILVDPQWENVKSLQKRVEKIFDVENVRFLTNDGCFIPEEEPIEIIKFFEALKAFIPVESLRKSLQLRRMREDAACLDENEAVLDDRQKKRKFDSGFVSAKPNGVKKCKTGINNVATESNIDNKSIDIISSTSDQKLAKTKSLIDPLEIDYVETENPADPKVPDKPDTHCKPTNRKKTKKNKHKKDVVTQKQHTNVAISTASSSINEVIEHQANKHVFYNDAGEKVTTTTTSKSMDNEICNDDVSKSPSHKLIFRNTLNGNDSPPRVLNLNTTFINISNDVRTKSPIEIQELVVLMQPTVNAFVEQLAESQKDESLQNEEKSLLEKTIHQDTTQDDSSQINDEKESTYDALDAENVLEEESTEALKESNEKINEETMEEINETKEENVFEFDSTDEDVSEVIDLADSDNSMNCAGVSYRNRTKSSTNEELPKTDITIKVLDDIFDMNRMLSLCKKLTALPSLGDTIIFKLLGLDQPDYFAGVCQYVNRRTKSMKLQIVSGFQDMPKKFLPNIDDSYNHAQLINIKLSEMFQPKVVEKKNNFLT